jgi:hypothetical protein
MHLIERTLAAALVLFATGLANAEGLQWVAQDAQATAVAGGSSDALALHVCRASLASGAVVPGKFAMGGECRFAADGSEHGVAEFQVLAERADSAAAYVWVPGHDTSHPQRSVIGGRTADDQRLLVCAAVHADDGSLHPGYIQDDNCVYGKDGAQLASDNYLVLASNDAGIATIDSAQPAPEGFNPATILAGQGVAAFCAQHEGACASSLPSGF